MSAEPINGGRRVRIEDVYRAVDDAKEVLRAEMVQVKTDLTGEIRLLKVSVDAVQRQVSAPRTWLMRRATGVVDRTLPLSLAVGAGFLIERFVG